MRVICINDNWIEDVGCEHNPRPYFGETDNVIDECWNQIDYYELERFKGLLFAKSNFSPLSSIDETEIAKQREEVLITNQ